MGVVSQSRQFSKFKGGTELRTMKIVAELVVSVGFVKVESFMSIIFELTNCRIVIHR